MHSINFDELQAENKKLRAEIIELRSRLSRYEISDFPRTYPGAKAYVTNLLDYFTFAEPQRIASELNRLGFPAFRNAKWTKEKVQRLIRNVKDGAVKTAINPDTSVVTCTTRNMKRISLVEEVA